MTEHIAQPKVWQSYVYHGDKCFFVSTINRIYELAHGPSIGGETFVWVCDPVTHERGEQIGHMGSVTDHQRICRCLIATGEMLDENNDKHERFFR